MSSSQSRSADARSRQQQSSHMLKTGKRGNPFCKDTHDLFATLMVSLDLSDRTRFFRTYPNSFTTDDAAANLSSLRFSQSNRASDPNDPQRIVTTTTTTTFSMSRDIAKGICQHFMDARLIENAADPASATFKDRGIYQITPKGLHVLERFITKNGISADHLVTVFTTQPICMKLLHLDRRTSDDEIIVNKNVIDVVFRRFAGGKHPNYISEPHDARSPPSTARPFIDNLRPSDSFDRSGGVELQDVTEKSKTGGYTVIKQVFNSLVAIDWLVDYSTCSCREEAAELLAHFVRYNLITLFSDKSKAGDRLNVQEVRGSGNTDAEYRHGPKVLYRLSDEGRRSLLASNDGAVASAVPKAVKSTSVGMETKPSSEGSADDDASSTKSVERGAKDRSFAGGTALSNVAESQITARLQFAELFKADFTEGGVATWSKDQHSTTTRLRAILDEPALRALFRDFLRANYCDENLGFWIDVSDFRRRFSTTSSAVGGAAQQARVKKQGTASNAMETHQQNLVAAALQIYNTYLAPLSPNELNIDHNLRADVVNYVNRSLAEVAPAGAKPDDAEVPALRATQVQTLLRQYERIQEHIFRLLATDQVPRFVRTEAFLALMDPEEASPEATESEKKNPAVPASASITTSPQTTTNSATTAATPARPNTAATTATAQ